MSRRITDKVCINCSSPYTPTSTAQKYCNSCREPCLKASACARKKRNYLLKPEYYKARERERSFNNRTKNPLKALYFGVKERCAAEGTEFNIELSDLAASDTCPVLKTKYVVRTPYAMSVDRIDPTKGYVKGNIQIISRKANTMKHNANKQELLRFADWVYQTYG